MVCAPEVLSGRAFVPLFTPSTWTTTPGFGLQGKEGFLDPSGKPICLQFDAEARRTGVGRYEVVMTVRQSCTQHDVLPPHQAVITVESSDPLVATYRSICSADRNIIAIEVRIHDLSGNPRDASFTVVQLAGPLPIP